MGVIAEAVVRLGRANRSYAAPDVSMMQATDFADCHDLAQLRRLDPASDPVHPW